MAILLVEQNVDRALEIADRAYVLEEGRIVAGRPAGGAPAEPRIQEAYLGLTPPGQERFSPDEIAPLREDPAGNVDR